MQAWTFIQAGGPAFVAGGLLGLALAGLARGSAWLFGVGAKDE